MKRIVGKWRHLLLLGAVAALSFAWANAAVAPPDGHPARQSIMAYSDYTYSDFTVEGAIRIVKACLAAQQPDMIVRALIERRSPESVEAELAAANFTPQPAAPAPAAKPTSIFSEPTPQQRDALTEAVRRRFQAMAGKPAVQ